MDTLLYALFIVFPVCCISVVIGNHLAGKPDDKGDKS